jgi:hypothetical protein
VISAESQKLQGHNVFNIKPTQCCARVRCHIFPEHVVNWLLTDQKILWTHMDSQGHVTKEGSRDTFIDRTQVYKGRT